MKNGKLKIIFFFSLMIFVIMFITLLVLSAATIFLIHFGILTGHGPKPLLIVFALMSLAVSTILSNVCIRKMVRPILEINEAAQKVARGDFEVKVSEQSIMAEVSAMAHNFNLMTQELAGMETFRSDFISNLFNEFLRLPQFLKPCFDLNLFSPHYLVVVNPLQIFTKRFIFRNFNIQLLYTIG